MKTINESYVSILRAQCLEVKQGALEDIYDKYTSDITFFLEEISHLTKEEKKAAYAGVIHSVFLDMKIANPLFASQSFTVSIGTCLHHLSAAMENQFEDFNEKLFWEGFGSKSSEATRYCIKNFCYYLWVHNFTNR